jgi:hypothetical protein
MMLAASEASPTLGRQVLLECLREFAHVRLTVSGACMEPALRDGDVVTLVAASQRRPRLGDVVLAAVGDGFQLHRLVWAPRRGRWRIKAVEVQSGQRTRPTRSTRRLLRSLVAVAAAHLRARRRPSLRG